MIARMTPGLVILTFFLAVNPASACSICDPNFLQKPTLREEANQTHAKMIFLGAAISSRPSVGGTGKTTFEIKKVLRSHAFIKDKKAVVLSRYIPVPDKRNPPQFLLFCDLFRNQLDPYRGVPAKTSELSTYMASAMKLNPKDRAGNLTFYFRYLEHKDPEIARDAFLEFAKASDRDIGQAAQKFSPAKLRRWLRSSETDPARLGIYAVLLGACGKAEDARLLRSLLESNNPRYRKAFDGLLAGYMAIEPREGWRLLLKMVSDPNQPVPTRLAIVRTLRFFHNWKPRDSQTQLLKAMAALLKTDLADLAIEDLRRWEMWDLTREILALYGKKGYDSPITKRAILRYALTCKSNTTVRSFLAERQRREPRLVQDVKEFLEFDKKK